MPATRKTWFARHSSVQGEWWIIDGQAIFADSDIGDMGHEAYVIDHVRRNYAYSQFDFGEWIDWDGFKKQLARETLEEKDGEKMSNKEWERFSKAINIKDLASKKLMEMGMTNEEMIIADDMGDARKYGVEHLGWKRIKGNNIETKTMARQDLDSISRGLWDAYDDRVQDEKFNIEVRSTRKFYTEVPYYLIEQGSPTSITFYESFS